MSITDELREYVGNFYLFRYKDVREKLDAIADRIDAEHERGMADAYLSGTPTDEQMAEHGWIRLPKDADGEYIYIGDVLTDSKYTFVVNELAVFGDGSWSIRNEDGNAWAACDVTHRHAPTVEDVLRAMLDALDVDVCADPDATIAEYAAKLTLRGDE